MSYDQRFKVAPDSVPAPTDPAGYTYFVADGTQALLSPGTPTPAAGTECKLASDRTITQWVAGLSSFNGRTSPAVVPAQADYDAFFLTPAEGNAAYDAIGAAAAAQAASQPLDATLTSLASNNWVANALPIGTSADVVAQTTFAANTIPARASTGNLAAKSILDYVITTLFAVADAAGLTSLVNLATGLLKGLMSPAQFTKLTGMVSATDYGMVGDLRTIALSTGAGCCSMGAGTAVLTDSSNSFTASDVGKRVTVPRAGAGSGVNAAQLTTTVFSFQNSGQVTLNAASTNAVTNISINIGTDNAVAEAAMVAAVNAAPGNSVTIDFVESATNSWGSQIPWVFNKQVTLRGRGGGWISDQGAYATIGGTRLVWWGTTSDGGTAFGAWITVVPTGLMAIKRATFKDIWMDCRNNDQNQALYAIKLSSCHGFRFDNLFVMDPMAQGIWVDIGTTPTEAKDSTRFLSQGLCGRHVDNHSSVVTTPTTTTTAALMSTQTSYVLAAANSLTTAGYVWIMSDLGFYVLVRYTGGGGTTTLTGCSISTEDAIYGANSVSGSNVVQASPGNGGLLKLSGGTGANTCCGVIDMTQVQHGTTHGVPAIMHLNSDSIIVRMPMVFGGNAANDAGSAAINRRIKPGVAFYGNHNATVVTAQSLAARNNVYEDGDAGVGGVVAIGVTNAAVGLRGPSSSNYWRRYQLANGAPIPLVEATAVFEWGDANGACGFTSNGPTSLATIACAAAASTALATIRLPSQGIQIGLTIRLRLAAVRTLFPATAYSLGVRIGPLGTAADPIVNSVSFTPTAAVDAGIFELVWSASGTLGAACTSVMTGVLLQHNAAAGAGHATLATSGPTQGTPVAYNSSPTVTQSGLFLTFYVTHPAASTWNVLGPLVPEILKGANP